MDVHPPQHAIHSWREFFVHMGTICLGLLIAIGLEQSVEALHHRHQARELRLSLRADATTAIRDAQAVQRRSLAKSAWLSGEIEAARAALSDGKPYFSRSQQYSRADTPTDASWRAAKTDGRASLLSPGEIEAYSEIDDAVLDLKSAISDSRSCMDDWSAERRIYVHPIGPQGSMVTFGPKSGDDLRQYIRLLGKASNSEEHTFFLAAQLEGAESAILNGKDSLDQVQHAEARQAQLAGRSLK